MCMHDVPIPQSMFRSYRQPSTPSLLPSNLNATFIALVNDVTLWICTLMFVLCHGELFGYLSERNWVHTPQTIQPPPVHRIVTWDQQNRARQSVSTCCRSGDLMGADVRAETHPSPSKHIASAFEVGHFLQNPFSCFGKSLNLVYNFGSWNRTEMERCVILKGPFRLANDATLSPRWRPVCLHRVANPADMR
jgi:hypothetical protein